MNNQSTKAVLQISAANTNRIAVGKCLKEAVSNFIAQFGLFYVPHTDRGATSMVEAVAEQHQLGQVFVAIVELDESELNQMIDLHKSTLNQPVFSCQHGKVWLTSHYVQTTSCDLIRALTAEIHRLNTVITNANVVDSVGGHHG